MTPRLSRRAFIGTALTASGMGVLSACGGRAPAPSVASGAATDSSPVTIEYWHVNGQALGGAVVKELIQRFQRQHPNITVEERFQTGLYSGLLQNLQAAVAGRRPPDVAQIGYPYLDYVAATFPVVPVQQLASQAGDGGWFDGFEKKTLAAGKVGGKQVAMPYAISNMIAYYNADALRAAGVDVAHLPTTWDGWRGAGQQVHRKTGKPALYIGISAGDTWAIQTLIGSNGAELLGCRQGGAVPGLDSSQAIGAVRVWADMVHEGTALNALRTQGQQAFLAGEVAVCFDAVSARQGFQQQAHFDLRAAPCPGFGQAPPRLAAGGNVLCVFSPDAARQRAAWEFVKFLESPQSLTEWTRGTGYLPPRKGIAADSRYLGGFMKENPIEAVAAEGMDRIVPWVSFPGAHGLDAQNVMFEAVQRALGGQTDTAAAMRDGNQKIAQMLKGVPCA